MKKLSLLLVLLATFFTNLSAHHLWLETTPTGTSGESQQIHVYYGEYTYDYYEKVDENFQDVEEFKLWVITPNGEKKELNATADGEIKYTAEFTPEESGIYTILLSSTEAEVVDWREYDLGVLKPNFYAKTSVVVDGESKADAGDALTETNPLVIQDNDPKAFSPDATADITVLFDEEPVAEQEVVVSIADQWTKTIYTDENGSAEFTLPWQGQYVIEVIYTEEEPGQFGGKDYEAVRHTATYTLKAE